VKSLEKERIIDYPNLGFLGRYKRYNKKGKIIKKLEN